MKNTWSESKYSVPLLLSPFSSNKFGSAFSLCVCLSLSFCASVFSVCLFSTHTDNVFQTSPSSQTSNLTLFSVRIKEKKKYTHFHLNIHEQQSHKSQTKKHKSTNIPMLKKTETRHKLERAHTHTHLPDTQHILTDKHTKKQQTQSTAQPEVYFMQKYSKVCFTIQLNIKGWYIPLWSLTPQWTNPIHPHPLTAYRESCWTSLLITR